MHYNFLNGVKFKIAEMKSFRHWLVPVGGIATVLKTKGGEVATNAGTNLGI